MDSSYVVIVVVVVVVVVVDGSRKCCCYMGNVLWFTVHEHHFDSGVIESLRHNKYKAPHTSNLVLLSHSCE